MNNTAEPAVDWFNEEAIRSYIIRYLKENKYKIVSDSAADMSVDDGHIVAISRSGRKELIEVKGYPSPITQKDIAKGLVRKADVKQQAWYWFSEALLTSFINFGRYSWSGKVTLALCLPQTERYQHIVQNVQGYFTANNLNLKIYLVAEDGAVEIYDLNENALKAK